MFEEIDGTAHTKLIVPLAQPQGTEFTHAHTPPPHRVGVQVPEPSPGTGICRPQSPDGAGSAWAGRTRASREALSRASMRLICWDARGDPLSCRGHLATCDVKAQEGRLQTPRRGRRNSPVESEGRGAMGQPGSQAPRRGGRQSQEETQTPQEAGGWAQEKGPPPNRRPETPKAGWNQQELVLTRQSRGEELRLGMEVQRFISVFKNTCSLRDIKT